MSNSHINITKTNFYSVESASQNIPEAQVNWYQTNASIKKTTILILTILLMLINNNINDNNKNINKKNKWY